MTHLKMHNVSCKRRLHVPQLELNAGMYGLIGPNGAGKTTLCLLYTSDAADE